MSELLFKPTLRGPMRTRTNSQEDSFWAGRTTLNSGSATVTVSTSIVQSDSIIQYGVEANTRQDSGVASPIEVMSIQDAVSFAFGTAGGETIARDTTIMWWLMRTSWQS